MPYPPSDNPDPLGISLPGVPKDFATADEVDRARTDRVFAAELIMGRLVPFNGFVGLEFREVTAKHVQLELPHRPEHIGDPTRPALHGGALAMLADTAGGTLVLAATESGDKVSTLDMRIDYLRPADLETTFADATLVRLGRRAAVVRIHVWQPNHTEPDGKRHIADSTAVYSVYRAE